MKHMNTDVEWEKWGSRDPYFGVLTHEKYRSHNVTEEAKREFFESGKRDIRHVLEVCRRHIDQDFSPKRVLDFGCGVGRHVIPLAEIAEHVVGLDVSDSMLKEAHNNCNKYSIHNVSFFKSEDTLSSLEGCFDLISSLIVFQHIPIERGRRIFTNLLKHLNEGGVGAIQFTYSKAIYKENYGVRPAPSREFILKKLIKKPRRCAKKLVEIVARLMRSSVGRCASTRQDPEMQMNPYNLNELFFILQSTGIHKIYLEFTDHGGELSVYLFFQKPKQA